MNRIPGLARKALVFVGSSGKDLRMMPEEIKDAFGFKLDQVQLGHHPPGARPFGEGLPADVLKLIERESGETYRAAYVIAFAGVVYVLDVLHKKSKSGSATPKLDKSRVLQRYRLARQHYLLNRHRYYEVAQ